MRFRLTYDGELRATGRDPEGGQRDPMAEHKQCIRKDFHRQLKQLWQTNKFLREHRMDIGETADSPAAEAQKGAYWGGAPDTKVPLWEAIAADHREHGYRFVPLVCERFSLLCSLDILFLRRDYRRNGVLSAGDLDNRVKTLLDTLRKPRSGNELRGNENPGPDEDPFFCLLENDDLVTALSVEADMLLEPSSKGNRGQSDVKLVISVEIKPADVNMFNLSFA